MTVKIRRRACDFCVRSRRGRRGFHSRAVVEPNVAEVARSVGARCLPKRGSNMRAGIERFVLEDIGFGDFEFRMPDGTKIRRVANMWEMEQALCADSRRVARITTLSATTSPSWFRARGETTLASVLRPITHGRFSQRSPP